MRLDRRRHGAGIRELRLERPPVNALDPELLGRLTDAIQSEGVEARALVLSGQPGMFSAGIDLRWLIGSDHERLEVLWGAFAALLQALAACPVPVAAAITGHAPAGGAVMALFCDYRVMADGDHRIGLNEVAVGIPLPGFLLDALARTVGRRRAELLGIRGDLLSPAEALRLGLVDEVRPADQVVEAAVEWCGSLLALPSTAMLDTRTRARAGLRELASRAAGDELTELLDACLSEATQAALRAAIERLR